MQVEVIRVSEIDDLLESVKKKHEFLLTLTQIKNLKERELKLLDRANNLAKYIHAKGWHKKYKTDADVRKEILKRTRF